MVGKGRAGSALLCSLSQGCVPYNSVNSSAAHVRYQSVVRGEVVFPGCRGQHSCFSPVMGRASYPRVSKGQGQLTSAFGFQQAWLRWSLWQHGQWTSVQTPVTTVPWTKSSWPLATAETWGSNVTQISVILVASWPSDTPMVSGG